MEKALARVAVVTGGHSYDVPNFHLLFRTLDGVDAYIQSMDDFASSPKEVREAYDAVLFYTMLLPTPTDEALPWYMGHPLAALSALGKTPQGIVVLHHAILGYPEWPIWSQLVGTTGRSFGYHPAETVLSRIVCPEHPIVCGLPEWTMTDETYTMADAAADSEILITYDHPRSMRTIAWTSQHGKSRVFCYAAGHDNLTWADAGFREVLRRGILWSAGRL